MLNAVRDIGPAAAAAEPILTRLSSDADPLVRDAALAALAAIGKR